FADLAGVLQALLVLAAFAVQWGYWIAFELLWRGQSPGKRLLKLRVVTLEGRPVGFFESALRNVARTADFLPFGYALGLLTMASNERSRRLGDLLAGTVVIRERRVDLSRYDAAATARAVDAEEFELLADFLARRQWLSPAARERVALELAAHFAERQSQPPPANAAEAEARLERLVGERRG
ncbi:MAG: RDD family protein, partial [Myxococcales bacterium]